ncbi:putative reverse transcriptase domain-containing protein [Tanacetum coccineum]
MLCSSNRLLFFQFSSKDGLDAMLENGPWFIHNNLFILENVESRCDLTKKDVGNVLVWVKLHGVPMIAFSKDGLSIIATKLGTSLMLDSYTFDMYMQSWGRSSYARAMIELGADEKLKNTIVMAMPQLVGDCATSYLLLLEVGVMERSFLSQKGSGGGRGVKEKSVNASNLEAVRDGVVPYVVDMAVEMEKLSSLEDTTLLRSFP